MTVPNPAYGVRHADTCPSGDRAELRGPCSCGAADDRPWAVRALGDTDERGRALVEVSIRRVLTSGEAVELALTLQELTREIGERWARAQRRAETTTTKG